MGYLGRFQFSNSYRSGVLPIYRPNQLALCYSLLFNQRDRRSCRVRSLMWLLLLQRSILGNAPCPLIEAVGLSAVWANLANTLLGVIWGKVLAIAPKWNLLLSVRKWGLD